MRYLITVAGGPSQPPRHSRRNGIPRNYHQQRMGELNNRISAFTVIETMVALVLTALAISFIFTGIRLVNRQNKTLTSKLAASGEIDRLYHELQTATYRASEIRRFPEELVFRKADTFVDYQIGSAHV